MHFTHANHYVRMLFARVPRVSRTAAICAFAAAFLLGASMAPAAHAHAGASGTAQGSTSRASGVNAPLALAGFGVLSTGLLVLGRSRVSQRRPDEQRTLATVPLAPPAPALATAAVTPRSLSPDPTALAPLAAIAGALHATADALKSIAPGLTGPAAGTVAASAERVREAQITIARWLETRR